MFESEDKETFNVKSCDNGYIVNIYIPYDRSNEQMEIFEKMTDKIIQANNKMSGDDWKNGMPQIQIPQRPKTHYTFVCKTKEEVNEKMEIFYKLKTE